MHDEAAPQQEPPAPDAGPSEPVQHCPYCGEHIGSFWGRKGDDGSHWCESCHRFFRVVPA